MSRQVQLLASSLIALTTLSLPGCRQPTLAARDITAAETLWKTNGLSSYRIELQVTDGLERHIEVTVQAGAFQNGVLLERADEEGWEPPIPLDETQARPYTVPGLFETLREELSAGQRTVTATFNPNRGYVEHMELGEIAGSEPTVVLVQSLEPL